MDIPSTNPALGGGEDTAAAAEQEQGQVEGSALPQGSKAAGKALFTPSFHHKGRCLLPWRLMPQSATLLLTKTLTKADGRQGAERERAQEWSWPQGERQRR